MDDDEKMLLLLTVQSSRPSKRIRRTMLLLLGFVMDSLLVMISVKLVDGVDAACMPRTDKNRRTTDSFKEEEGSIR